MGRPLSIPTTNSLLFQENCYFQFSLLEYVNVDLWTLKHENIFYIYSYVINLGHKDNI